MHCKPLMPRHRGFTKEQWVGVEQLYERVKKAMASVEDGYLKSKKGWNNNMIEFVVSRKNAGRIALEIFSHYDDGWKKKQLKQMRIENVIVQKSTPSGGLKYLGWNENQQYLEKNPSIPQIVGWLKGFKRVERAPAKPSMRIPEQVELAAAEIQKKVDKADRGRKFVLRLPNTQATLDALKLVKLPYAYVLNTKKSSKECLTATVKHVNREGKEVGYFGGGNAVVVSGEVEILSDGDINKPDTKVFLRVRAMVAIDPEDGLLRPRSLDVDLDSNKIYWNGKDFKIDNEEYFFGKVREVFQEWEQGRK